MQPKAHRLSELEHRELRSSKTGEAYSLSAVLTGLIGFKDLFVHHEILPPGRRASAPHAHSEREEMVLVLEGCVRAMTPSGSCELGAGEFAGFAPGEEHVIQNDSTAVARVLVIASNPPGDRIV